MSAKVALNLEMQSNCCAYHFLFLQRTQRKMEQSSEGGLEKVQGDEIMPKNVFNVATDEDIPLWCQQKV
jgi:hypothetical protein